MSTFYLPDLLYEQGGFTSGRGLLVSESGSIERITSRENAGNAVFIELRGKALLPGFVNAHSHSFQRLIRGRSESRVVSGRDFWSWRGTMYHAAAQLTPQEVYDVARMAFLEMLLSGTTTVGEFHYLHTDPAGRPYEDPNLLSNKVIAAAQSVGIRIVLLRTAYIRSGFEMSLDPGQARFFESTTNFLRSTAILLQEHAGAKGVTFGVAPHSIRAVPLDDLQEIATWTRRRDLPLHMHVSEQIGENTACVREYGCTPVRLLNKHQILSERFTAVHAIHIDRDEIAQVADAGATICSCPTTERNLGDGILSVDHVMRSGIRIALGSDSQAQIDPCEDARQLEYHLRLRDQQRSILDLIDGRSIAENLFSCATRNGARALSLRNGKFHEGFLADAFTVDLRDLSIAGNSADNLLPTLVFSLNRTGVVDVIVDGAFVLRDRKHILHDEIVTRYREACARVWGENHEARA